MTAAPESSAVPISSGPVIPALLALSLIPFAFKALGYALIDSMTPLAVFVLFLLLLTWGLFKAGPRGRAFAIGFWSVSMLLWGVARLALLVLHLAVGVPQVHISSQFTPMYLVISSAYIVLGVALFRERRPRPG